MSNVLVDLSGNGNTATIHGCISTKDGLRFDGVDDYVNTNFINSLTGSISLRSQISNNSVLIGGRDSVNTRLYLGYINSNVFIGLGETTVNTGILLSDNITYTMNLLYNDIDKSYILYINGINSYSGNYVGSLNSTEPLYIGNLNNQGALAPNWFNGEIQDIRIYNKVLSEQEIQQYHNSFITTQLIETFKDTPVGNYPIGWTKVSGEYSIQEMTTQDTVLQELKIGTKYLRCDSSGIMAIPSKTAYGTWEFDVFKSADINSTQISIITTNKNINTTGAYKFFINSSESLQLIKTGETILLSTANSYIQNNTWYRIKIIRTTEGEFTVYIKGGNFGNEYVLVDVTGGSGTNPVIDNTYTKSDFFVTDIDAGDEITNIEILDGIEQ